MRPPEPTLVLMRNAAGIDRLRRLLAPPIPDTKVPVVTPPLLMVSTPPEKMRSPLAWPPDEITMRPLKPDTGSQLAEPRTS